MVNNNLYMQNDDTLYFTFDGVYSKLYNIFITKEDRDDFITISEISNNIDFTTPTYGNSSYLNSNNISQYTINFHIAAYDVNDNIIDHIKTWLRIGNTGTLFFDTNKFWGYNAIISNITENDRMYMDNNNYIISYSIEFKTIGLASYTSVTNPTVSDWQDTTKETSRTFLDKTINNDLSIPEIDFQEITTTTGDITSTTHLIYVPHVVNGGYYINFQYPLSNDMIGLRLLVNDNIQFQYEFTNHFTNQQIVNYNSSTGLLMIDDKLFDMEITPKENVNNKNNGILLQHSYAPIQLKKTNITGWPTGAQRHSTFNMTVNITDKTYYQLLLHNYQNAFISVGHTVNLEPLYGLHPYGHYHNTFYPYRYSNEGCLWYKNDLSQMVYNDVENKIDGIFNGIHNCNSRIIAENASNLQYYIGNYDIYKIQIKTSTNTEWHTVPFYQGTGSSRVNLLTFGIEKYKQ